jgi:crotonobetainyl-CoA:carnitine CoA-transferase CaiB-like acyl-CoA transferase
MAFSNGRCASPIMAYLGGLQKKPDPFGTSIADMFAGIFTLGAIGLMLL